jgi:hypothetical protein
VGSDRAAAAHQGQGAQIFGKCPSTDADERLQYQMRNDKKYSKSAI